MLSVIPTVPVVTFDSEGIPPQKVTLVKDGIVSDLLMSRIPRDGFSSSTGHGRSLGRDRRSPSPVSYRFSPKNKSSKALRRKGIQMARQTGQDYILVVKKVEPLALSSNFEIAFSGDGPLSD